MIITKFDQQLNLILTTWTLLLMDWYQTKLRTKLKLQTKLNQRKDSKLNSTQNYE